MITIGNDWDALLKEEWSKEYYKNLRNFLIEEYQREEIYPDINDIFNALKYTSYQDTKVVIMGQDPYINPGEAHGLAFSVQPTAKIPPSLMNIFKEIRDDWKDGGRGFIPDNGSLISWAQQGVLLLNTVLTVRRGRSNSHSGMGWEIFTDKILEIINKKDYIVYMLWGKKAQQKIPLLTNSKKLILKSVHPSPLAGGGFIGCGHFHMANEYLFDSCILNHHSGRIQWQVPNIKKQEE